MQDHAAAQALMFASDNASIESIMKRFQEVEQALEKKRATEGSDCNQLGTEEMAEIARSAFKRQQSARVLKDDRDGKETVVYGDSEEEKDMRESDESFHLDEEPTNNGDESFKDDAPDEWQSFEPLNENNEFEEEDLTLDQELQDLYNSEAELKYYGEYAEESERETSQEEEDQEMEPAYISRYKQSSDCDPGRSKILSKDPREVWQSLPTEVLQFLSDYTAPFSCEYFPDSTFQDTISTSRWEKVENMITEISQRGLILDSKIASGHVISGLAQNFNGASYDCSICINRDWLNIGNFTESQLPEFAKTLRREGIPAILESLEIARDMAKDKFRITPDCTHFKLLLFAYGLLSIQEVVKDIQKKQDPNISFQDFQMLLKRFKAEEENAFMQTTLWDSFATSHGSSSEMEDHDIAERLEIEPSLPQGPEILFPHTGTAV